MEQFVVELFSQLSLQTTSTQGSVLGSSKLLCANPSSAEEGLRWAHIPTLPFQLAREAKLSLFSFLKHIIVNVS